MNAIVNNNDTTPSVALKLLVEQHGAWKVLRALAAVLLPERRVALRLDDLTPYMRRDLGLPPVEAPRKYWELR
jgi:hypothetical protein